ncbi:MAG: hypothetical protein ABII90_08695 [Bacteroidota bacterium]
MKELTIILTILSAIIAVAAVFIAYMQYRANRYKIKADLFDRRYAFSEKYRGILLQCIIGINKDSRFEIARELGECERLSKFLFDDNFHEDIKKTTGKVKTISQAHIRLQGDSSLPIGNERNQWADKKHELISEIELELETLENSFSNFMQLNK